ncbi:hypothetical protein ECTPHS_08011, partial [Ectothiorhodospira sp. PHS-1]
GFGEGCLDIGFVLRKHSLRIKLSLLLSKLV